MLLLKRILGVFLAAAAGPLSAQPGYWIGGTDTSWETSSNWIDSVKPSGPYDFAYVSAGSALTVSSAVAAAFLEYDTAISSHTLTITGSGNLTLHGGILKYQEQVFDVVNHGSLSILGGSNVRFPTVTNHGTFTVGGDAALDLTRPEPDNDAVINSGTMSLGGSASLVAGGIGNTGTLAISDHASMTGGWIGNTGTLTISGNAAVTGGIIRNQLIYDEEDLENEILTVLGRGSLVFSESATLSGGEIRNDGDLSFSSTNLTGATALVNGAVASVAMMGQHQSLGSLAGGGAIDLNNPGGSLTIGSLNDSTTFSGTVADYGNGVPVIKVGTGTFTIDGAWDVSGPLTISAGRVALGVNNTMLSSPSIKVASGATFDVSAREGGFTFSNYQTLSGAGTVVGAITMGGGSHLAPGDSAGTITFTHGLTLSDGVVLDFELGTVSDRINVTGGTLVGSASSGGIILNLGAITGFASMQHTFIDFSGAELDGFELTDISIAAAPAGYSYSLAFVGDTVALTVTATAIPEPSTSAALAGAAMLAWVVLRRGRRKEARR